MEDGIVSRVGLDVFEKEPLVHPYLMKSERATLLPVCLLTFGLMRGVTLRFLLSLSALGYLDNTHRRRRGEGRLGQHHRVPRNWYTQYTR